MSHRTCKKCNELKLIVDFAFDNRRSTYTDVCRECKRKSKSCELEKIRKNMPEKLRNNFKSL